MLKGILTITMAGLLMLPVMAQAKSLPEYRNEANVVLSLVGETLADFFDQTTTAFQNFASSLFGKIASPPEKEREAPTPQPLLDRDSGMSEAPSQTIKEITRIIEKQPSEIFVGGYVTRDELYQVQLKTGRKIGEEEFV